MVEGKIYDTAIIGGGAAGVMAVNRSVLNNDLTLFFPGTGTDKKRSRALWVSKVENMPGLLDYKKGIEEPNREMLNWLTEGDFGERLAWQKNRGITEIKKRDDGLFQLRDNKGESYLARFVILCTGVMDVQPLIEGSIEPVFPFANAQWIDYCLRCDGHHVFKRNAGVIGHDSGAAWVAVMLFERYGSPSMTVFTHGEEPKFSDEVLDLMKLYGIKVKTEKITKILGPEKPASLEGFEFSDGSKADVGLCFVSLGMIVYNELALALQANVDPRGFVMTDAKGESSVANLFVAGDLRAGIKKQIYTAWDSAVDSADEINRRLRAERRNALIKNKEV